MVQHEKLLKWSIYYLLLDDCSKSSVNLAEIWWLKHDKTNPNVQIENTNLHIAETVGLRLIWGPVYKLFVSIINDWQGFWGKKLTFAQNAPPPSKYMTYKKRYQLYHEQIQQADDMHWIKINDWSNHQQSACFTLHTLHTIKKERITRKLILLLLLLLCAIKNTVKIPLRIYSYRFIGPYDFSYMKYVMFNWDV